MPYCVWQKEFTLNADKTESTILVRQEIRTRDVARKISNPSNGIMGSWVHGFMDSMIHCALHCNLISTKRLLEGLVPCQILRTLVRPRIVVDAFHWLTACSLEPARHLSVLSISLDSSFYCSNCLDHVNDHIHFEETSQHLLNGVSQPRPLHPRHQEEQSNQTVSSRRMQLRLQHQRGRCNRTASSRQT
jgi:hypothetical protein